MRIGTRGSAAVLLTLAALGTGCSDGGDDDSGAVANEITVLGDEEICDGLTAEDVGAALGLDVAEAAVGGSATAQCVYDYETASGVLSNATVASMASDVDLGGRTGDDAFDHVVELNRGIAGGTDVDEVDVDAGDRAVRLSGTSLHLGVIAVGGHLLTVLVPADDADPGSVDDLLAVVADRFGG